MPKLKSFYHFLNLKSRNCIKSSLLKFMVLSLMTATSFSQVSKELPKTKKKEVLTLSEYFDFSCPLSAQSSKSLRSFKEKVGDRVLIERRSLSFSKNDLSWLAGKYYHALLHQDKSLAETFYFKVFEKTLKGPLDELFLKNLLIELGVDSGQVEAHLTAPFLETRLRKNEVLAQKSGIFVSPGYTFLGKALVGKQDEEDFGSAISRHL